ncbi:MAG: hypothetical protein EOM23_10075, partial [Candidatus Moranbacteria bacterium]|nr:hypothetical protein [Candidatus Moranbacteria bacterium]
MFEKVRFIRTFLFYFAALFINSCYIMKIENSIAGEIRGKIGEAIFQQYYNKNVVRTRPWKYNTPETPERLLQVSKFKSVVNILKPLLPFIRVSYSRSHPSRRPWNAAITENYRNADFALSPSGEASIIPSSLIVSSGSLPLDPLPPVADAIPGFIIITHSIFEVLYPERFDDIRISFIFKPNSAFIYLPDVFNTRSELAVAIPDHIYMMS